MSDEVHRRKKSTLIAILAFLGGALLLGGGVGILVMRIISPEKVRVADRSALIRPKESVAEVRSSVTIGHPLGVRDVAIHGRLAVSGGADHVVRLWDIDAGRELLALGSLGGVVHDVAFSPDGKLVLAAGEGRGIVVWVLPGGEEVGVLAGSEGHRFRSLAIDRGGKHVVAGDEMGYLRVWSLDSGFLVRSFPGHGSVGGPVHYVDGGQAILGPGDDEQLAVWSDRAGEIVQRIPIDPSTYLVDVEGRVVGRAEGGLLEIWDAVGGRKVGAARVAGEPMALSADGRRIATREGDKVVVWDLEGRTRVAELAGTGGGPERVVLDAAGGRAVGWGPVDGGLTIWSVDDGKVRHAVAMEVLARLDAAVRIGGQQHLFLLERSYRWDGAGTGRVGEFPEGARLAPDGEHLVGVGTDGRVGLWSIRSSRPLRSLPIEAERGATVRLSADEGRLVVERPEGLVVFDAAKGDEVGRVEGAGSWTLVGGGTLLAAVEAGGGIGIFDLQQAGRVRQLEGALDEVVAGARVVALHETPDGLHVAAVVEGEAGGAIVAWRLANGRRLGVRRLASGFGAPMALSADGRWLAAVARRGGQRGESIEILRLPGLVVGQTLLGHPGPITGLAVTAEGGQLLSSGGEGTIRVSDPADGRILGALVLYRDGEWFFRTPEGQVEYSSEIASHVGWVDEQLDFEKLGRRKHTGRVQGLVAGLLTGDAD